MPRNEDSADTSKGAALELDDASAHWLSDHLENFIIDKPVNTEPEAHRIVTDLHSQGF